MSSNSLASLSRTILGGYILKDQVWLKGHCLPGQDETKLRYDDFGNLIAYDQYGNKSSEYGWEIDHINARALGGGDDLANLRPLHCKANASLGGLLGALTRKG